MGICMVQNISTIDHFNQVCGEFDCHEEYSCRSIRHGKAKNLGQHLLLDEVLYTFTDCIISFLAFFLDFNGGNYELELWLYFLCQIILLLHQRVHRLLLLHFHRFLLPLKSIDLACHALGNSRDRCTHRQSIIIIAITSLREELLHFLLHGIVHRELFIKIMHVLLEIVK